MAVDDLANLYALRARLISTPDFARAEGALGCSPSEDGQSAVFTRSAGSFVADGFVAGAEVRPAGFSSDAPAVATFVSDERLVVDGARPEDAEAGGRALAAGLPAARAWEGEDFKPTDGQWYAEEDYAPVTERVVSFGAPAKVVEADFLYVVKLYTVSGKNVAGAYVVARSILNHFPPGLALALPNGDALRVRGNPAPSRGQLLKRPDNGRSVIAVTINLRLRTTSP